jgi:hypothetical protein
MKPILNILYDDPSIDYLFRFIKPSPATIPAPKKMSKGGEKKRLNRSCIGLNRNHSFFKKKMY